MSGRSSNDKPEMSTGVSELDNFSVRRVLRSAQGICSPLESSLDVITYWRLFNTSGRLLVWSHLLMTVSICPCSNGKTRRSCEKEFGLSISSVETITYCTLRYDVKGWYFWNLSKMFIRGLDLDLLGSEKGVAPSWLSSQSGKAVFDRSIAPAQKRTFQPDVA